MRAVVAAGLAGVGVSHLASGFVPYGAQKELRFDVCGQGELEEL